MSTDFARLLLFAIISMMVIDSQAEDSLLNNRTWTSSDGSKTFEGKLTSYDPDTGTVRMTLANGKRKKFNKSLLSAEDITLLENNAAKSPLKVKNVPDELPDPDGTPADMNKPVQVFILLGQSNMLGFGNTSKLLDIASKKNDYAHLVDDDGNWTTRKDVRNVRVMNYKDYKNDWLTVANTKNIGPEIGIGTILGEALDAPVLILKSCIGNRSLGWDLLPPGSEQYEFDGKVYAGYKESPLSWDKGATPKPIDWYAGKQYDDDIGSAKKVLENLDTYYPGAKDYVIAGFIFWQGDKDRYNAAHASHYEQNLVHLIKQLRKDFEAPDARFVCATLGQTKKGASGNDGEILKAQLAVDGESGKYKAFKGNVATVYTHPLSKGGASNSHYGGNPETYMDVGLALGRAMAGLLAIKK